MQRVYLIILLTQSNFLALKAQENNRIKIDGIEVEILRNYHPNGQVNNEWTQTTNDLHGYSRSYYENGQLKSDTKYVKGKKQESDTHWYENGRIKRKIEFEDGQYTLREYYEYGQIKEESQVSKLLFRNGLSVLYFANGQIQVKSNYNKEGKSIGEFRSYFQDGSPAVEAKYDNGHFIIMNQWSQDGELLISNGEGTLKSYNNNGSLKAIEEYKNGLRNGNSELYKNGKLNFKATYVNGKSEGETIWYYPNGNVKEIIHMKGGIMTHAERNFPMFTNPILKKSIDVKPSERRDENNALITIDTFPTLENEIEILQGISLSTSMYEGKPQDLTATEVYRVTLNELGKVTDFTKSVGSGYATTEEIEQVFSLMQFDMKNQTTEMIKNQILITFKFWQEEKSLTK